MSILAGHINFDRLNIGVLDLENYSFIDAYIYGLNVAGRGKGHRRTLEGTVVEAGIATGKGIYVGGEPSELLRKFPRFGCVLESGIKSMLAVPLYKDKSIVAALVLASINSKNFDIDALELTNEVGRDVVDQVLSLSGKDL